MTNKFKVGDKARITGNTNRHHFKTGEVVTLVKYEKEEGWECNNLDTPNSWYVKEYDMEPYEEEQLPTRDLTLQEKFEQGWGMKNKHVLCIVTDLRVMKNNYVAVVYDTDSSDMFYSEDNFLSYHTITPPAPKRYSMFTFVYNADDRMCDIRTGNDFQTLEEAKANMPEDTTCILEHEKQGDKWVFIKAHTV